MFFLGQGSVGGKGSWGITRGWRFGEKWGLGENTAQAEDLSWDGGGRRELSRLRLIGLAQGHPARRHHLSLPLEHSRAWGAPQAVAQGSRPCRREKQYLGNQPSQPPGEEAEILSWGTGGPLIPGSAPPSPASACWQPWSGFPGFNLTLRLGCGAGAPHAGLLSVVPWGRSACPEEPVTPTGSPCVLSR